MLKNSKNQYLLPAVCLAAQKEPETLIKECEDAYSERLGKVFSMAAEKKIILVSGPSASGKTTTAQRLCALAKNAVVVSMDDFYKDREDLPIIDGKPNAEVIEALDLQLLENTLSEFIKTGKCTLPRYDFSVGKRLDNAVGVSGEMLIIEGLHALNPLLRDSLPRESVLAVYVSPHSGFTSDTVNFDRKELRFLRRLVRDFYYRSASAELTFKLWEDVSACEDVYIRPLGKTADIMLDTTHSYEICVLKDEADKILAALPENSDYKDCADSLRKKLAAVCPLSAKAVPESSLLNEFLPRG